jgi:predicted nucleic acid-binding Zn ribbon protein
MQPINDMIWTCKNCGKQYPGSSQINTPYCSTHCEYVKQPEMVEKKFGKESLKKCQVCGRIEYKKNYCSDECKAELHRRAVKASREKLKELKPKQNCAVCGKESTLKFCSDACRAIGHSITIKEYHANARARAKAAGGSISEKAEAVNRVRVLMGEVKRLLVIIEAPEPADSPSPPPAPSAISTIGATAPAADFGS